MDFSKAKEYIVARLVSELPKNLAYHGAHHTFDVVRSAQKIGKKEGLMNDDMFLLLTAAYFHDAGFLFEYHKNEPLAVELAQKVLPEFGYGDRAIESIGKIILATEINLQPTTLLEKIMCDADHDYFGRSGYEKIANNLRNELIEYDTVFSDAEWLQVQIEFLDNKHQYYTVTSIRERLPFKQELILSLKGEANRV